jgi:hypothetical protein
MTIYIYKRENEYRFLTQNHSPLQHERLIEDSFKHISTIEQSDLNAIKEDAIRDFIKYFHVQNGNVFKNGGKLKTIMEVFNDYKKEKL